MNKLLFCVLFSVLVFSNNAISETLIVGISPYQSKERSQSEIKQLLNYFANLPAGDTIIVIDAYHQQTLGEFIVPVDERYNNPKARLAKNGKLVSTLLKFSDRYARNTDSSDSSPSVRGAVRMPQFLRYVRNHYPDSDQTILLIGSIRYDDPRDSALSMARGHIPSDGHIKVSRALSVYGTAGAQNLLGGGKIFWVNNDLDNTNDDRYEYFAKRFWHLFIHAQGGYLASLSQDLGATLNSLEKPIERNPIPYELGMSDRLEMISLRDRNRHLPPIHQRELSDRRLTEYQLRNAVNVEIGLSWICECDLDLYARPWPGAEVLFFGHSRSPQGRYFKDYQSHAELNNAFETIAFDTPIDLSKLQVAINYYSGQNPEGARGELRISIDGETYKRDFIIQSTHGDEGASMTRVFTLNESTGKYSVLINPLSFILREGGNNNE